MLDATSAAGGVQCRRNGSFAAADYKALGAYSLLDLDLYLQSEKWT
jgi:hypothetical protein